MMRSAQTLIWHAAGKPDHQYPRDDRDHQQICATCGDSAAQIPIAKVETSTTSGHADLFRHRNSRHICDACAWLFSAGKGRPGNFIAAPHSLEYTVISLESVVEDKRPWMEVLRDVVTLPGGTPVTGVMTTDVKPRLWQRCRLATVNSFGLYVHAAEYDVSEWRQFDLQACLELINVMVEPLSAGFSKASLYHSLLRDYPRASRMPEQAIAWDRALAEHRGQPHFLPALIAAGVTKESKHDVKNQRPDPKPVAIAAGGDQPDTSQLGLF